MSKLLSSPPMTLFSKPITNHRLTNSGLLTFHSTLLTLKPTTKLKKLSVKSRQGDTSSEGSSPRYYVGHSIYKGKAALTIEPKAPEFVALESGAFKLVKEGFLLLQFAPAAGVRQYDWSRKQVFSLSITEIGNLISLGPRESCEFFHDPFKGKGDEGKVRKVLKVEPLPDGSGRFFNLSVQNKLLNVDENVYIPITKAEFAVLVSAFNAGAHLQTLSNRKRLIVLTMNRLSMEETTSGVDDGEIRDSLANQFSQQELMEATKGRKEQ